MNWVGFLGLGVCRFDESGFWVWPFGCGFSGGLSGFVVVRTRYMVGYWEV